MSDHLTPDLCIIGDSAGGVRAALVAAAFGLPTVLIRTGVQDEACMNGKHALLAAASDAVRVRHAASHGIGSGDAGVNFEKVSAHVRATQTLFATRESDARFRALGIRVLHAAPQFQSTRELVAGEHRITARRFIIATGSPALVPPQVDAGAGVWTPDAILDVDEVPRRLAVIGGDAEALEFAQAFRRLGAEVILIAPDRLLPGEDEEQVDIIATALRRDGVAIRTHAPLQTATRGLDGSLRIAFGNANASDTVDADAGLFCGVRQPAMETLGLAAAGVGSGPDGIHVDDRLRTDNPAIFALSPCAALRGGSTGVHAVRAQADRVMRQILFRMPARYDPSVVPRALFTEPEFAAVGQTEQQARARHGGLSVLRSGFSGHARAVAAEIGTGHAKILLDRRGRLLGASLTGPGASALIAPWAALLGQKPDSIRDFTPVDGSFAEVPRQALMEAYAPVARSKPLRMLSALLRRFG